VRNKIKQVRLSTSLGLALGLGLCLSLGLVCSRCAVFAAGETSPEPTSQPTTEQAKDTAKAASWSADYAGGMAALDDQNPTRAEGLFRQALSKMEKEPHKPSDQETCMRKLADALLLRAKPSQAQKVYQNLLALLTKRYGINSPKTAPLLMMLGSIQESQGNHSAAMELYQKALSINERNFGPYSPQFAGNLHKLGRASAKAGHTGAAEKDYKQALSILSNEPGLEASGELSSLLKDYNDLIKHDDDSNTDLVSTFDKDILGAGKESTGAGGGTAQIPAQNSSWQKQNTFTLRAQSQSQTNADPLVVLRGMNEPTSEQNLAPVYKTMSDTIFKQSHFEKGEDYYKRKIAIDMQALGPDHPSVANDLCGLAVFYMSGQNYAQAKPLLTRALPIYEHAWGDNNLLTINTRISLASVEFHLGNTDGATKLYRQALNQGQSVLGPNSLETARILNDLAYLSFHQGKLEEACTFYEWALASTEGAVGQKDPLLAACLKDYAQVLRGLGRTAEATAVESRAEGILAHVE
jgi:tetratricopeptide (TPR) repeat protein